jgi:PqqD family protein of HPr-rel-A system
MTRKSGMKTICALRAGVSWVQTPGEPGFLFAARTGGVFALNRTAAAIMRGLEAGRDRSGLVADLVEGFETDELEAGQAVDSFLASLREAGLVAD